MIKEWNRGGYVKLAPGVTRLPAGLPFGPKVEDPVDSQGAGLGKVKYTRSTSTATSSSGAVADWSCTSPIFTGAMQEEVVVPAASNPGLTD